MLKKYLCERNDVPTRAQTPPLKWTTPEPAKSEKPSSLSHPSGPQHQWAEMGYVTPVTRTQKIMYPLKLHRSAMAPDTIVTQVAANVH